MVGLRRKDIPVFDCQSTLNHCKQSSEVGDPDGCYLRKAMAIKLMIRLYVIGGSTSWFSPSPSVLKPSFS